MEEASISLNNPVKEKRGTGIKEPFSQLHVLLQSSMIELHYIKNANI